MPQVENQLNSVQNATTQLQTRVDQRTLKLEEQSSQVRHDLHRSYIEAAL